MQNMFQMFPNVPMNKMSYCLLRLKEVKISSLREKFYSTFKNHLFTLLLLIRNKHLFILQKSMFDLRK